MIYDRPFEDFQRILHWQHITLKLLGCDVFGLKFRRSALTYFIIFLAVFYMVISFVDLYLFRNNIFDFIFVLVTFFYGVIGCGRLGFLLSNPTTTAILVSEAKQTYKQTSQHDTLEQEILLKYTKLLKRCVLFFSTIFLGGVILCGVLPLMVFLLNGEKILPFGVIVPLTNPNTDDGYQLNYLYQVSCLFWTPPGLTASQNVYFALVFNICIQYDLLILKLQVLDEMIARNVKGELDMQVREKLVEIIQNQQRLADFITTIENLYAIQTFVEVGSNALQIVVTLFVLHIDVWLTGYMVILIATFQLFLSCLLGTLIDVKNQLFTEKIYNISWHLMRNLDQKTLKLMLAQSQRPMLLSCGRMMTLNMNLFLAVYKKIYSIFMMLQNM